MLSRWARIDRALSSRRCLAWLTLALFGILCLFFWRRLFAHASGGGGGVDPFSEGLSLILLELAAVIVAAFIGRGVAKAMHQPGVLGELILGVIVGNVMLWLDVPLFVLVMELAKIGPIMNHVFAEGLSLTEAVTRQFSPAEMAPGGAGYQVQKVLSSPEATPALLGASALWMLSNLGVILLLVMVGMETSVKEMTSVGLRSSLVAVVGVVAPMVLGYIATLWLLPEQGFSGHLFIGAVLCATSVGITARVFRDLRQTGTNEAKIILGAAVLDDVLGLIILAVTVSIVQRGELDWLEAGRILLFAGLFLGVLMAFGERAVKVIHRISKPFGDENVGLVIPLGLALILAWFASTIQLAAIVGAFAAGLILRNDLFPGHEESKGTIEAQIGPLESVFAPVFFVLMGMQVNLQTFTHLNTLLLAAVLTAVAVAGKLVCGLVAGPGVKKLAIGLAMVPRGEVGLIFAGVGKGLGVIDDGVFSAIVIMVIVTTIITPITLRPALGVRAEAAA